MVNLRPLLHCHYRCCCRCCCCRCCCPRRRDHNDRHSVSTLTVRVHLVYSGWLNCVCCKGGRIARMSWSRGSAVAGPPGSEARSLFVMLRDGISPSHLPVRDETCNFRFVLLLSESILTSSCCHRVLFGCCFLDCSRHGRVLVHT